jgi:hypothetical protein
MIFSRSIVYIDAFALRGGAFSVYFSTFVYYSLCAVPCFIFNFLSDLDPLRPYLYWNYCVSSENLYVALLSVCKPFYLVARDPFIFGSVP